MSAVEWSVQGVGFEKGLRNRVSGDQRDIRKLRGSFEDIGFGV